MSVMFQNPAFQVQSVCESLERPADDSHMCSSKSEKSRSPTNRTFRHIERASGAETCRSRRSSSLSDRWNPDAGCRFFAVPRGRRARALSRRVRVHSCAVPNKINSLFVTPFVAQVRRVIVGPVAADTNFTRTVETHRERAGLRAHRSPGPYERVYGHHNTRCQKSQSSREV